MSAHEPFVLVVEDEKDSRETLRDLLQLEGFRVDTAANGADALTRLDGLRGEQCLVVLLDLFMPVMDGWQLLDELRAQGRLGEITVFVTTSAGHRAPAGHRVFPKPLDLDKLLAAVEAAC
jgi:CheY-like chemotaxis protein